MNMAATKWWIAAMRSLRVGKLVAIDYFLTDEEFWRPERSHGTARAYQKHHVSTDLLANPGHQDITAHVFLRPLQTLATRAGLTTEPVLTQAAFLTGILKQGADLRPAFRGQFQTLTHPEHLGQRFKVLIQSRDHCQPSL
jgi:SAM-dependent MidA family methyltransferase